MIRLETCKSQDANRVIYDMHKDGFEFVTVTTCSIANDVICTITFRFSQPAGA